MRALELALLEVKRLGRGPALRTAVIAAVLLPLLLGVLYLWSFWNPYERLRDLPVAIVNADQPVTTRHGSRPVLAAGDDLQRSLLERGALDWHMVDAATAREGLADGRYYMTLTVPRDFSARLASPSPGRPSATTPRPATLVVRRDDATSYLAGRMTRAVLDEVRAAFSNAQSERYLDRIYLSFAGIHNRTARAARDTRHLAGVLDQAGAYARGLTGDLDQADSDGALLARQAGGLASSGAGLAREGEGLGADAGRAGADADRLAADARSLDQELAALDKQANTLTGGMRRVTRGARLVAQRSDRLAGEAAGTADAVHQAAEDAKARRDQLRRVLDEYGVPAAARDRILADADAGVAGLERADADARHQAEAAGELASGARDAARDNRRLAEQAPELADAIGRAAADADRIARGAGRLDAGAAALADAAGRLAADAAALRRDARGTAADAQGLSREIGDLSDAARGLGSGLHHLGNAAEEIARGIGADAARIPDYSKGDRARHAAVESDPVLLQERTAHPVRTQGDGFAPYFIPLALWVGALVGYVALRPLSDRALATAAPSTRVTLAGWLPAAALGAVQALALLAVARFGLGLEMGAPASLAGFLVLAGASFVAIAQWLQARFGRLGRLAVFALLVVQLTASGGVYPVETMPAFFRVIHPYLPMTYATQGIRQLVSGDDMGVVGTDAAVLAGFLVAALALTTLTARRLRTWTVRRLHPELAS